MRALRTLLAHLIDYAGLFPPAGLSMADAAERYAAYRVGPEAWMLGRFVVPATRLDELAAAIPTLPALPNDSPWILSALLGPDAAGDLARIAAFHDAHGDAARVDSIEAKAATPADVSRVALAATKALPAATVFVELPSGASAAPFADAALGAGVALKLRTGGVTADAFPSTTVVLDFLAACAARGVSYKLTAGLHHPMRSTYPLTYEPGCDRGPMYGFLNLFVAASLLAAGHDAASVAPLLVEEDPYTLLWSVTDAGEERAVCWRGLCAGLTHLTAAGRRALSFGSCSFEEPVADLRALGLLPASSVLVPDLLAADERL